MLDFGLVDRLERIASGDAPIVSVYLTVPADPGSLPAATSRLHALVKPLRELIESRELTHAERESLRADLTRLLELGGRLGTFEGRALAIFACAHAGLWEEAVVEQTVRDRVVVDATPYLRPLLAVLDESHHYAVVIVDRKHAWLYAFTRGRLESAEELEARGIGKRGFGGWHGLDEHPERNREEEHVRRHLRETARTVSELMHSTRAELLIVGGHEGERTVPEFLHFLPHKLQSRVIGTFAVDTNHTTAGQVRERTEQIVSDYEREEEARLANEALERVAAHGFGAAGLEWCLLAVNERGVQLLLIHDDEEAAGRVCDNCGYLGLDGAECPVCGRPLRETPDVIDEMAVAVIDAGGQVEHVYAETELAPYIVAAFLRFPVPAPSAVAATTREDSS